MKYGVLCDSSHALSLSVGTVDCHEFSSGHESEPRKGKKSPKRPKMIRTKDRAKIKYVHLRKTRPRPKH